MNFIHCLLFFKRIDNFISSLFVRNYTRCLRSLYVKCGRHPLGEHNAQETNKLASDVVYNELRGRLQTYEEDVEQFYINYMTQCFGN